jgi:hypothetical protein
VDPAPEVEIPSVEVEQEPTPPTEVSQGSEKAQELLNRVAAAQFSAKEGEYVDTLDLGVTLSDRGEHPRDVSFSVYYSSFGGEELRLIIDDPERGTRVAKGFQGRDYWLEEGDGVRQILSGHEFSKDRKSIDEAMDLCSDLLLLVDVRNFQRRQGPTDLLFAEDGTRILVGALRRPDGLLWDYRLGIPEGSLQPAWLEVQHELEPTEGSVQTETESGAEAKAEVLYQRFQLLHYKGFDGRQAPQVIEVFHDRDAELPLRILWLEQFQWRSHPAQG